MYFICPFQELVAVAFSCAILGREPIPTKEEQDVSKCLAYRDMLMIDGCLIPDPLLETDGWVGEKEGRKKWPPCMCIDISEYFTTKKIF